MQNGEEIMEVRTTEDGLLRAFGLLVSQQSNRQVKQKHFYRAFGNSIHATRKLSKAEAKSVAELLSKMKTLNPQDEASREEAHKLMMKLSTLPVKFVPVKHEQHIDSSKTYPYRSAKRGG
jgi:seryl-tRNA synthetase